MSSGKEFDDVSGTVPVVADGGNVLKFQDSSFVPGSSSSSDPKISAAKSPVGGDDSFSTTPGQDSTAPSSSNWAFFSVSYYRPYFDIDTSDVVERIRDSLLPFQRSDFLEKTSLNPDMYGPFWICTTLIFVTGALGNLSSYLSHTTSGTDARWTYDINKISWATAIFYGYCGVLPVGLYFLLRYLDISSSLAQLWCLYGYSLFVFIPTSFLSVVPLEILRWIFVLVATVLSALFLGTNLKTQISITSSQWVPLVGGAVALQLLLGFVLKLYFFTYFTS